jgi:hypothetical protein
MSDQSEHIDPIDRLFKKKAEEHEIPFREEDWNRMEQQLNSAMPAGSADTTFRWLAAAALLLAAMLGYFTYDNHQRLQELDRQVTQLPPLIPEQPVFTPPSTAGEGADEGLQLADPEETTAERTVPIENLTTVSAPPVTEPISREVTAAFTHSSEVAARQAMPSSRLAEQPRPVLPSEPVAASRTPVRADPFTAPDDELTPEQSRFSLTLAATPDLSTVGSVSNFYDPGYKLGALIEYRVSHFLSLSAGVLQSFVRYTAQSGQYNPETYWPGGVSPDELTAECLLFDIPITAKVNLLQGNRSRFFATAGLSSYIMQREEYEFRYSNPEPAAGQPASWSGNTGTVHLFSNAAFSAGYEFDLNRNLSLRAEPFIRVPIREVGWGNVKLYSVGSFVSVNLKL